MPVRVVCPSCGTQLNIRDEHAGRAVKCPKCGGVIPPGQTAATPPAAAVEPPPLPPPAEAPAFPPRATPPAGRPVASRRDDEDDDRPATRRDRGRDDDDRPRRRSEEDDDRPRSRRRSEAADDGDAPPKKKGTGMVLGILAGLFLVCCGGGGGAIYWFYIKAKEKVQEVREQIDKMNLRVNRGTYDQIQINMTRVQVDQRLGENGKVVEPDELATMFGPGSQGKVAEWKERAAERRVIAWWNGDDFLLVCFYPTADAAGKVQAKAWEPKSGAAATDGSPNDQVYMDKFSKFDPNAATPVTAEELGKAYQADKAAADAKYKGKLLLVEGKLDDITDRTFDLVVNLKGPPPPPGKVLETLLMFACDEAAGKELRKLSRGQTVKIRARCEGYNGLSVNLVEGKLVSSGPDPSVKLTAAALLAEHAKDAEATDKKYEGKAITLTDAVVERKEGATLTLVGGPKKGGAKARIKATLPLDNKKQLDALNVGSRVTVKGEYGGSSEDSIDLDRCWVAP